MKVNELMIGDLVKYDKDYYQVLAIFTDPDEVYVRGTKFSIRLAIKDIEPILLTAEILEKNGHHIPGYLVWNLEYGAEVQLVPETHSLQNPRMGYRLVIEQKFSE